MDKTSTTDGIAARPTGREPLTDAQIADACRAAGMKVTGTDEEIAAAIRTAYANVVAQFTLVWNTIRPIMEQLVALDLADIAGPEAEHSCNCLCGMHRTEGMFCAGSASRVVDLTSRMFGLTPVSMCPACADWWTSRAGEVVAG